MNNREKKKKIKDLTEKRAQHLKEAEAIERELQLLKVADIKISEHAIVRYLERIEGLDIEEIKSKILPEDVGLQIVKLGGGQYPVNNKHKLTVKSNTVVTVLKI